jgi:hypothetical protein
VSGEHVGNDGSLDIEGGGHVARRKGAHNRI